ncbi:TetR family transcriptional regulator [Nostoc carneum NIES-2107]|nr:TetR family transcriptional regulator [Nostoc carneum NIES-2107]
MLNQEKITFELSILDNLIIPERSRLYHLQPISIGTEFVESLTSYIARLADSHSLPPGVLMETEVAPVINKPYGGANLHRIYDFTGALNGTGVMASDLVQALEKLTWQNNLRFLTWLTWSNILPTRNLLHRHRAWCPSCYQEWHTNGQAIYEPLLWTMDVVKVCPLHQRPLEQICHNCGESNFLLAWRSRPGYCSKCLMWLGLPFETQLSDRKNSIYHELKFEIWIAKTVGELLAQSPYLAFMPSKDSIAKALCAYVDQVAEGNIAAFARQLQIPRNTVWLWCKGQNLPSINALLQICYSLKISVLDFITQGIESVNSSQTTRLPRSKIQSKPRASSHPFDADSVMQYLEAVLVSKEYPSPSMEEVARRLKCNRRTVYKHFPDLCRAISANYLNDRKAILASKIEQSCNEVQEIARSLHNKGQYPSEARVSKQMTMPGCLRYQKVRAALQNIQYQLCQ